MEAAGEEPNGAFWEGVANYVAPRIASRLEMDSEGSMFAVYGDRADLEKLRELLLPLVHELPTMTGLLRRPGGWGRPRGVRAIAGGTSYGPGAA